MRHHKTMMSNADRECWAWIIVIMIASVVMAVAMTSCQRPAQPVSDPLPPPVLPADVPNVPTSSPADVPTWSLDRLLATAMGLPTIANITVRVGAVQGGYKIGYGPAFSAQCGLGVEPRIYVESRNVRDRLYIYCTAYAADDSVVGTWRLAYGVGQGFRGLLVKDIPVHGQYYGVHIILLPGDVNGSLAVDADDVAAIASHNGEVLNADNRRFDVTLDGYINSIDKAMVARLVQ